MDLLSSWRQIFYKVRDLADLPDCSQIDMMLEQISHVVEFRALRVF
ncbi:hypothetical protein LEP3755_10730 [Leptolyngbya sp. NIES-3755]|nr:hypothetical protein LEP3755_10730 [Leptolyngbya sp. NIES-3755]